MIAHTPGPWKTHGAHADIVSDAAHRKGDFVAAPYGSNSEERDANALLIAAAPEMAAALLRISGHPNVDDLILADLILIQANASAALRKAGVL